MAITGKDAEGKNRIESKDKKGNFLIKDILAKGKTGSNSLSNNSEEITKLLLERFFRQEL